MFHFPSCFSEYLWDAKIRVTLIMYVEESICSPEQDSSLKNLPGTLTGSAH